ncbi:fumarylacetoacetate hydrolase family protein [Paenibacillus sp. SC116]|uniref:fumarylacetoacetate hydrolase family protein n=1 Tax=Paenibacillus sp. SC116 TaxID=2968986 RepID=UPI00215A2BB2|nr:fumarylacetoacetate hydrolase family protein [Paenibacillus sp. SC116]MCR8843418.1 fumarylacetoacetate hydrolase family protein [Paenibacillus sp. SC116]
MTHQLTSNHEHPFAANIRNVYCIGRNYKLHALELGNDVPTKPMVFMKPSHSVVPIADRTPLELPLHQGAVHHEIEIVLYIGREVTPDTTVDEAIEAVALGLDFTLRDVQETLKAKGHPWLPAKGVHNSGPITNTIPFEGVQQVICTPFALLCNGEVVQQGTAADMIFDLQQLIQYVASNYGLSKGDVIFTGTPAGVGAVQAGDVLELQWNGEAIGSCVIEAKQ